MANTSEILAELEELGATGADKAPPIRVVEEVSIESGSPSPRMLDERGEKMIELSDLVIQEFDNLIESAKSIRNAVAEMREMWRGDPSPEEEVFEEVEEVSAEEPTEAEAFSEDLDGEDEVESSSWGGVPTPTGSISLSIPESVPLPPEVERLTDADLSIPPPVEEGTNEQEDEDGTEVPETPPAT